MFSKITSYPLLLLLVGVAVSSYQDDLLIKKIINKFENFSNTNSTTGIENILPYVKEVLSKVNFKNMLSSYELSFNFTNSTKSCVDAFSKLSQTELFTGKNNLFSSI